MANEERLLEQYKEANAQARHYSNLRFASLTVFLAITFGLLTVVCKDTFQWLRIGAALSGLIVTIVFWLIEAGINTYIDHFHSCARSLEGQLRLDMWCALQGKALVRAHTTMRILFLVVLVFWAYAACKMLGRCP